MNIFSIGKSGKLRKTIGFLLAVLMILSVLAAGIPTVYAEETPQPTETSQPTETPQPTETVIPTDGPQESEEAQPTETPEATGEPKASEPEPEDTQPSGDAGDNKKSGKPDKGSLSAAEKKLSSRMLQLVDDNYLPSDITRNELLNQMAVQNQIKQGKEASDIPGSSGTGVHVYIQSKKGSDLKELSKYADIENTDKGSGLTAAWIDPEMIINIASLDSVKSVREVLPPIVRAGSELSEGDALLNTDDVRAITGADGKGVKVGIISDGVDNLSSAVASGDLPGGTNSVRVLGNSVGGDEGTAMLEIVHDMAPGAELYFHDCGDNTLAFKLAIIELAKSGCDIICDDIGWIAEPFFEDGSIAQYVAGVMDTYGLIYVSSAGNAAKNHYQGKFIDLGTDMFGDECPTADFSGGNGPDPFLYVRVPAKSSMIVVMEWNDPFGNSKNDYDLELYDKNSGAYLDGSYYAQNGTGSDPLEGIVYDNSSTSARDIKIRACKYYESGSKLAEDKILEIYTYGCYTYPTNTVAEDSIFGHPAVPGVLSCGAIDGNSADGADYGSIEDFSSRGPVTMISGTREKPDICGIDGVSVTGAGGFPNPFYGTSASAPHIAAVAALLKSLFPAKSSSDIKQMILNNSVDLGSSGYDNTYGYGQADALAVINNSCKVTFDSRDGSSVDPQWVQKGDMVRMPQNPSKTGYIFTGWYKEPECITVWNFKSDTVTSYTTLYAKWKNVRDVFIIEESETYDVSDYGEYSQININPGLTVTLTNSSESIFDFKVSCGEEVSLTINNLTIKCSDEGALSFTGDKNRLILVGENTLTSGLDKPGIKVEEGTSLEILGGGSLLSVSGSNAAGIGAGNGGNGGSIAVSGGTVYAWGKDSPYDIGGGKDGTGGTLSISGDSAVLLANGTSSLPTTSTHRLLETKIAEGDIVFGKIGLPDGWPETVYAYLNSGALSTLTYDSNGGSGTVPDAAVQYTNTAVKLSKGTSLTINGFSVSSWNTQADGLGTSYKPDTPFTITEDTTLYAVYATIPETEYNAFDNLGFVPMDTAIDPNRDVVYMTESGGYRLYRVDLNTGKIGYIEFSYKAERLTVKNDKVYVTLPHGIHDPYDFTEGSGSIAVVDAASFTLDRLFDEVPDPYDIEVDSAGRAYIGSGSGQWSILTVYDTKTGEKIDTVDLYDDRSLLDFNSVYNKLYSIDTDSSPRDMTAYEINNGDITSDYGSPYHGDYEMSTYMKISPDGKYIFNGSGNIFTCAPKRTGDMVYAGNIGLSFDSICFDTANNEFIITNSDGMYIYDYGTRTVKAAQGSRDSYKGVFCSDSHFVSLMGTSEGKYYIVLDDKTPGLDVKGVTLNRDSVVMMDNAKETLTATTSPLYATNQNMKWTSSNESTATVSDGVITAVGAGSTIITVTSEQGGFKDTCNVTVLPYEDYSAYNELWFTPMDSAIDPDRNYIYMTETGGYRLYRIDIDTGKIDYINLPYKAERLTVNNDKIYVTMPHGIHDPYDFSDGSGSIAVIDASTFSIDRIFDEVPDPYDIEVDDAGRAYIGSGSGQWSFISVYDTKTGQQIDSYDGLRQMSLLDFNTVYNKLYSIDTDSSPRDIEAYEIVNGEITASYDSPYHGDYAMSTYMKISPDGKYIFNGSGNIFKCAPTETGDMVYDGSLGLTFSSICFDAINNEFTIANNNGMYIYDYDTRIEKAAQGSKDYYKGVYCNKNHFVSLMMNPSSGKYYLVLDYKTPGLDVTGVTLSTDSLVLLKDETETLTAAISPRYATNQNLIWTSSNESVATVSNGLITAVGAGSSIITVTTEQGGFKDTCNVIVIPYEEYNAYNGLWFTPMDTAKDPDRSVIYMTETGGNKLYRIDLSTGEITYIKFPYKAERLAVKNGKIYVALPIQAHKFYLGLDGSGYIGVVDAATFTVDKIFSVVPDPYDIEADDSGRVYIGAGSNQMSILTVYDTETGEQVDSVGSFEYQSLLDFNPVYNKLYSIPTASTSTDITAYEITNGNITTYYEAPYNRNYSLWHDIRISPDGKYIFNGSGNILTCAPTKTGDMVYKNKLSSAFTSVCFDLPNDRFYTSNGKNLTTYAYSSMTALSTLTTTDNFITLWKDGSKIAALMKNASGKYYINDDAPDTLLTSISINGTSISGFDPMSRDITVTIPTTDESIDISASAYDSYGQISGDIGVKPMPYGRNTYSVTVTGGMSGLSRTYTLNVYHIVMGNAYLSGISTTAGTLSPVFDRDTINYSLNLSETTTDVVITPVKDDSQATIKMNGSSVSNKTIYISNGVSTDLSIEVTASDGYTKKTYTIHITRAVSTDARLGSLSVSSGTMSPFFNKDILEYSLAVASTVSSVWVSAYTASNAAALTIDDTVTNEKTFALKAGETKNVIIHVTAQDGVTKKTYTVHITRTVPDNANLSGISLSNGTLSPVFSPNTLKYSVELGCNIVSTKVTPVKDDIFTTFTVKEGDSTLSNNIVSLSPGQSRDVKIVVTAQDRTTTKEYTLHITRAPYSSNANLSGISVTNGTLDPVFDPDIVKYTVNLPCTVGSTTITATKADSTATLKIGNNISSSITVTVYNTGDTKYAEITVIAQDGTTKKYIVYVKRAPSSDANLSAIGVTDGSFDQAFSPDTLDYNVTIPCTVESTTITPITTDNNAKLMIDKIFANSRNVTLDHPGDSKDVSIEVTAQDEATKKTYILHVKRDPIRVTGMELNKSVLELAVGDSSVINCNVTPEDATNKEVVWASDHTEVAVVSGGKVTAIGTGTATITVTTLDGSFTDTCTVIVKEKYSIAVNSNNANFGTVIGGGMYEFGDTVTLTASPKPGYMFYRWAEGSTEVSTSKIYTFTATRDRTVMAVFGTAMPPDTVTAKSAGYSSIRISWSAVPGASGYQLSRSKTQDGTYSPLIYTNSLAYSDTKLDTGTTYYYKVRAYCTVGKSKVYGYYSSITSALPVLSLIANVSAIAYYPTSIKVSWDSVPGRTKYEVWRSTLPDSAFNLVKTTSDTYFKDTTLTPFVTYYYQIKVYRTVNKHKIYSLNTSPTASATPVLGDVTNVKAASSSASSIKVSWSPVTGASGYGVWRSEEKSGIYTYIKSTKDSYYNDPNRIPNTVYYYYVKAYRTIGSNRIYSNACEPVAGAAFFGPVTGLKAVRYSTTKIKLTWNAVSGSKGYEIYRSNSPDGLYTLIGSTKNKYYYSGSLTRGTTYYYKILAYIKVGGITYSNQTLEDAAMAYATP